MKKGQNYATRNVESQCDSAELYLLGLLSGAEKAEFEKHLEAGGCACRQRLDENVEAIAKLAMLNPVVPDPALRERLRAQLHKPSTSAANPSPERDILAEYGSLVMHSKNMEWAPGPADGVWCKFLSVDERRKYATSLVRLDPGVHYPPHRHAEVEEAYMLAGDLRFGDIVFRAGDYCRAEPGSVHPTSYSEGGCLLLIMTSINDEILAT